MNQELVLFAKAVARMRAAQQRYFAKRTADRLREAKHAEAHVDKWLRRIERADAAVRGSASVDHSIDASEQRRLGGT